MAPASLSARGRVLTAKHLAPDGYACWGVRGTAAKLADRKLIRRQLSRYDAMLLDFVPEQGETFSPVGYAPLDGLAAGTRLNAYGFSVTTGEVVLRPGTLSTTVPDEQGMLQTDNLTTSGSGAPAVDAASGAVIPGLVASTAFDASGVPTYYAVLATELLAQEFGLPLHVAGVPAPTPPAASPPPAAPPVETPPPSAPPEALGAIWELQVDREPDGRPMDEIVLRYQSVVEEPHIGIPSSLNMISLVSSGPVSKSGDYPIPTRKKTCS